MLDYIQTWANISRKRKYFDTVQDRSLNDKSKSLIENAGFPSLMLEIIYHWIIQIFPKALDYLNDIT